MRAVLFAAGLGTRLAPLTKDVGKPALPLMHEPIAAYGLAALRKAGASDIVANTFHCAARTEEVLTEADPALLFARESELLGTAGGLRNALEVQSAALGRSFHEDAAIVVWNGDIAFDACDLSAAIDAHRTSGALATMVVRPEPRAHAYGAVEVDASGCVRGIGRKGEAPVGPAYMFTGVHVLRADAVLRLPSRGCIIEEGYRPWLREGAPVHAHVDAAPFRDLGTLADYLTANVERAERAPDRAVAKSAHVEGASIVRSVVGEGARVGSGCTLERALLLPGASVSRSIRDAIVTASGTVIAVAPQS